MADIQTCRRLVQQQQSWPISVVGGFNLQQRAGQVYALFFITVAAAEAAVGLAMIIAIYRSRLTVNADEVDTLKG